MVNNAIPKIETLIDGNNIKISKITVDECLSQGEIDIILKHKDHIESIEYKDNVLTNYRDLSKLINILDINHIIKLDINKLYNINTLKLLYNQNPNIVILYGYEDVNIGKFIEVYDKLDKMIEPILGLDLSFCEKYLYIFNIVTHIKKWKYKKFFEDSGLSLFEILDEDNDLIVCGGFSKLLDELCKRIGILSTKYRLEILEDDNIDIHVRNIVKINDKKYDVQGLFISDTTFNNDLDKELYTTAFMTPRESSIFNDNIILSSFELLLNFDSYDEFISLIQIDYQNNNLKRFKELIDKLRFLYKEEKIYDELKNDYYALCSNNIFLKKLYDFLSNNIKKINIDTIVLMLSNLKKKINPNISEEELYSYKEEIIRNYNNHYQMHFIDEIDRIYK